MDQPQTSTNGRPVVRAEGAAKHYGTPEGPFRALDGVDLAVDPGEFVAVMGPSGSGKTTLLNLLGTLDTPTAGEIWIGEDAVSRLSDEDRTELRCRQIGFVFQQFNLMPHLNALENVALPLVVGRHPRSERVDRAAAVLDRVGLSHRAGAMPSKLSGGEQQRVAVARALVHEPPILLADEPTGNLDSATGLEVMELISELRHSPNDDDGHAVVLVTHDERMAALADRVVHLRDGRLDRSAG